MYHLVENIITIKHKEGQKILQAVEAIQFNVRQYSPKLNLNLLNGLSDIIDRIFTWDTFDNYMTQDVIDDHKAQDLGIATHIIDNFGMFNHCESYQKAEEQFKANNPDVKFKIDEVPTSIEVRQAYEKLSEAIFKKTLTKVSDTEATLHMFTVGSIVENLQKVTLFREECTYELEYKSETEHLKVTFDVHGKVDTFTDLKEVVTP